MFGRRTTKDASATTEVADKVGGKGRPTPTRKEAEAARKKRNAPPRTRKEAAALQRQRTKENRQRQRAAMDGSGSERDLPARDRGPVKAFVRDYVDSRFTVGQFLLPFMFVMFALVYVRAAWAQNLSSSLFLTAILVLVLDSVRISRGVKKAITARFSRDEASGHTMYALLRAWQMRRLRLPKPRVKVGDHI
ncbi:MAG TPA: DUF3043 domain-containing protein [Nocardioidaceae bacterium]